MYNKHMKKKIGEIYNKPIVIGDKNLVTKNEIHKDDLSAGSGDAPSGGGDTMKYYNTESVEKAQMLTLGAQLIKGMI